MKNKKLVNISVVNISLLVIFYLVFFTSCEKTTGCMNSDAINYNSDAGVDDGSCYCKEIYETTFFGSGEGMYYSSGHYYNGYVNFDYSYEYKGYHLQNCADVPIEKYLLKIYNPNNKILSCDITFAVNNTYIVEGPSAPYLYKTMVHVEHLLPQNSTNFIIGAPYNFLQMFNLSLQYYYYCYVNNIELE